MNETQNPALDRLVQRLRNAPFTLLPDEENWKELIARIKRPGILHQIEEDTYRYYLEILPPFFLGNGFFAFCEGREPLRLFFDNVVQHFCRQLTWEETQAFCTAAGVPLPQ